MKNKKLLWLYVLSASVYFTQGIESLPSLPLFAFLKEYLHFTPEKIMYISSIITLPWLIKPIFGMIVDLGIPILKIKNKIEIAIDVYYLSKRTWIVLSLLGSIFVSLYFGLSMHPTLPIILIVATLGSYFTATRDISNDGLACQKGKEHNTCHIYQNVQWTSLTVAGIITSLAGGFIADHFNYRFAYLCLIPVYFIILWIVSKYNTSVLKNRTNETLSQTILSYKELFTNKPFLLGCIFIFLYNFNPSFGTPLQFIQRNSFNWSFSFMGIISTT